jgi:RNA polymerase sigma-70 factor, ECF subfamily
MYLRKQRRYRRELPIDDAEQDGARPLAQTVASSDTSPAEDLQFQELLHDTLTAAATMGSKYQQIFALRYLAGFTETEIATVLDLPLATVKTRAFRARRAVVESAHRTLA